MESFIVYWTSLSPVGWRKALPTGEGALVDDPLGNVPVPEKVIMPMLCFLLLLIHQSFVLIGVPVVREPAVGNFGAGFLVESVKGIVPIGPWNHSSGRVAWFNVASREIV